MSGAWSAGLPAAARSGATDRLGDADRRCLDDWWAAIQAAPGLLPAGVEPVQQRLVRWVGRADLPSGLPVFLKVMGFPRPKDRFRYLLRPLPARHEAALLGQLAAVAVPVPPVVAVRTARRRGWPHASLLVTRALAVVPGELPPGPVLDLVVALRDAGVFHPDLHSDNFLLLAGDPPGQVAVLDLQSARRRRRLGERALVRMLVPLFAHRAFQGADLGPWCAALATRGIDPATVARIRTRAEHQNRRARCDWIRRCLQESTTFAVRRGLWRVRYERRAMGDSGEWVDGGTEMVRYWIGDRAGEVLAGAEPSLTALDRPRWGWPGRHRLRLVGGAAALADQADRLLAGYRRYREELSRTV